MNLETEQCRDVSNLMDERSPEHHHDTTRFMEQMLYILKPLLLAQQEAILSRVDLRMDQLEESVQTMSLDLADLRTGFQEFFDEYQVEYGNSESVTSSGPPHRSTLNALTNGHFLPTHASPENSRVKPNFSPVDWTKTTQTLPIVRSNSSRDSVGGYTTYRDTGVGREQCPETPRPTMTRPSEEGSVDALRRAVLGDPALPSSFQQKDSPTTPNRCTSLSLVRSPISTPTGPFCPRHHASPLTTCISVDRPQTVSGDKYPLNTPDQASTGLSVDSEAAILRQPTSSTVVARIGRVDSIIAEGTTSDWEITPYLNQDALSRSAEPEEGPMHPSQLSWDLAETVITNHMDLGDNQSTSSSEIDALATECILFKDGPQIPSSPNALDQLTSNESVEQASFFSTEIGSAKLDVGMSSTTMIPSPCPETVDCCDLDTLSPLTTLSSLSVPSSPSPGLSPQKSLSVPAQSKLKRVLITNRNKSVAATRIKKRRKPKIRNRSESASSETEPPTKRVKHPEGPLAQRIEVSVSWPVKAPSEDGFIRKVILCDSCLYWYHYGCVGILDKDDRRLKRSAIFMCPVCEAYPLTAIQRRPKKGDPVPVCAREDCNQQATEFHVAGIIGRHRNTDSGKYYWLVKWDGYPVAEATWEGEDSLADPEVLINRFIQAVRRERGNDFDKSGDDIILLKEAVKAGWQAF